MITLKHSFLVGFFLLFVSFFCFVSLIKAQFEEPYNTQTHDNPHGPQQYQDDDLFIPDDYFKSGEEILESYSAEELTKFDSLINDFDPKLYEDEIKNHQGSLTPQLL